MRSGIESESRRACRTWSSRLRRGGIGAVAMLAIALPAAMRDTPAAAAPQRVAVSASSESVSPAVDRTLDRGVAALRRGQVDLVATYRTSSEDPCLVLRRRDANASGGESTSIAMLVRLKQLDLWVLYVSTADEAIPPRTLEDPKVRMRWRASRGVLAIALDPDAPRAVEAAASAWYAHRPPASEGSVMAASARTEEPMESRRFAARRIAR